VVVPALVFVLVLRRVLVAGKEPVVVVVSILAPVLRSSGAHASASTSARGSSGS